MATLAESFVADVMKQNADRTDSNAGWQTGAKLAELQQARQQQAAQIKQRQQELETAKVEKMYSYIKEANQYKNAGDRRNYLKSGIGYRNAMGVSPQQIPDDSIMQLASDENMGRMFTLEMMVDNGEITAMEGADLAFNPMKRDKFAQIVPTPPELMSHSPDLSEAQQRVLERASKEKQAQARVTAGNDRAKGIDERQLRAQRRQLSDDYNKYNLPGMAVSLEVLDKVIPAGIENWQPGQKLPGFEGMSSRVDARNLKGDALKLRQAVQTMFNETLKIQSGTAVTAQELVNLRQQLGYQPQIGQDGVIKDWVFAGTANPEALVNGIRNVKSKIRNIEGSLASGYPEVYDDFIGEYNKRRGKPVAASDPIIPMYGKEWTRTQWEQFKRDHPDDPAIPEINRALGVK